MSISINSKTDYSNVISQSLQKRNSGTGILGSSNMASLTNSILSGGGDNTLADYAAIKNGSYGKLMKAYYSEVATNEKASSDTKDNAKTTDKETEQTDITKSDVLSQLTGSGGNINLSL